MHHLISHFILAMKVITVRNDAFHGFFSGPVVPKNLTILSTVDDTELNGTGSSVNRYDLHCELKIGMQKI